MQYVGHSGTVCVCVCVFVCHPKWWVTHHVLAEEAKESGCFARSWLAASAGHVLQHLMEPQLACRGFSPARSAAPQTVMDHCAPATRTCALLNHLPPHPLDLAWLTSEMPTTADNSQAPNRLQSALRLATSLKKDFS